jgi:hypothetical protein
MDLKQCINFLLKEGYLLLAEGKFIITNSVYKEIDIKALGKVSTLPSTEIMMSNKDLYKHFIEKSQVPYRLPLGNGGYYTVSAYSKNGEKYFLKALKEKRVTFELLSAATRLYYTQNTSNKVTITNFFVQGIWESEYDMFVEKMKRGEIKEHIENSINGKTNTLDL